MKRYCILVVCLAMFLFCACSVQYENEPISADIEFVSADFWPDNVFTADLPRPEAETYWVLDESDIGRYSMSFSGISDEEVEEYVSELKKAGFREYRRRGNDVSVGYIFYRGETYLSLSCSEGTMGFTVVIDE